MAKVKFFDYPGSEPAYSNFEDFAHLEIQDGMTEKKAVFVDAETGNRLVIKGANLEFSDHLEGWVTSLTFIGPESSKLVSITKAKADGNMLWRAYDNEDGTGDIFSVLQFVLRGKDTITGSGKADYIDGYAGKNTIHGGGGADEIYGGEGKDRLFGDNGNDTLYGFGGNDRMTGGKGSDEFSFYDQTGKDVITDFDAKGGGTKQDYLLFYSEDTFTFKKAGKDVLIQFDDGDTLRLLDVPFKQFNPDDDIRFFDMA